MFITIEGLDGAGLSTQAGLLRDYLLKKKKKVILTKEMTDGLVGGLIKAALRKEWDTGNLTIQNLFTADRAHHLATEIEPALKKGLIVVSDRYILSTLAYGALDVPLQYLKQMNALFRKPDLTFILDVHPSISLERIKASRYHVELFEVEQKLHQIRKNYLALKNYFGNTFVIDANNPKEKVFEDISKILDKKVY